MSSTVRISLVIFDMDGVLTDSEPLINAAAVAMFRERGLVVHPEDFRPFVGTGEDRYIGGVAEKYQFAVDLPAAKRRTYEIYLDLVATTLQGFPGAVELVRQCRAAGLKVAVASSADAVKVKANLDRIGLPASEWDAVITGESVIEKKPAPQIFLKAAGAVQVAPSECVVVEDAVNGVTAAKRAGMRCVAVAQTFAAEDLSQADLVRPTIADITLADLGFVPAAPPVITGSPPIAADWQPVLPEAQPRRLTWGFWASMGFWFLILVGWVFSQAIGMGIALGLNEALSLGIKRHNMETSGLVLTCATVTGIPAAVGLGILFAYLRRGLPVKDYVGLRWPGWRSMVMAIGCLLILIIVSDLITYLLGRPIVPEVMVDAYRSAGFLPLFWFALVIAAPVAEEFMFRGFVFEGLARSRVGWVGAAVLTSLVWAVIHLQYDWYGISTIFVAGMLMGYLRWRTGSVWTTVVLHSLMNLVATIQTWFLVQKG